MSVVMNDAAITAFFNTPGGRTEALLLGHAERVRHEAVQEADAVMRHRYDTSQIVSVEILEGPLRASVGLFDPSFPSPFGFLSRKAQEETGWLAKAVAKAREI